MKITRRIALTFLAIVIALSLASCSGPKDTAAPANDAVNEAGSGSEDASAPPDGTTDEIADEADIAPPPDNAASEPDDEPASTVVLYQNLSEEMGMPSTDIFTVTAKGDTVETLQEYLEIDVSELDDETKEGIVSTLNDTIVTPAQDIEGIVCTGEIEGNVYTIYMTVNCTGNAVSEAAEAGILQFDGSAKRISLEKTISNLQEGGYKVVAGQ